MAAWIKDGRHFPVAEIRLHWISDHPPGFEGCIHDFADVRHGKLEDGADGARRLWIEWPAVGWGGFMLWIRAADDDVEWSELQLDHQQPQHLVAIDFFRTENSLVELGGRAFLPLLDEEAQTQADFAACHHSGRLDSGAG